MKNPTRKTKLHTVNRRDLMRQNWGKLKDIINASARNSDLFLTLIDEEGVIHSVNSNMQRGLELKRPQDTSTNFFDLVHPVHREDFKTSVRAVAEDQEARGMELYIKNGHYHPMKWMVNYLSEAPGEKKTFFCLGYKILDDERLNRFNKLVTNNYQLIIENLSGIAFHDSAGDLIAANQQLATIFGSTLEELYSLRNARTSWNTQWEICDEDGERVPFDEAPFVKAIATGLPQKKTLVIRFGEHERRWLLFSSTAFPDAGAVDKMSVVSSVMDVTNEKQLKNTIKDRDTLIDTFLHETPNLAWVIDENAKLIFASSAFFNYFGLDEKICIGKDVTTLVPQYIVDAVYPQHIEVLETGRQVQSTEKIKLPDGKSIVSLINIFPVKMASGKNLLGGQSVTLPDKSHLEKELHQVQERLLTISRVTNDAIWEWDMQNGQIFRNESLMKMIGYQSDNSRGLSWWLRRIHPDDRNRVADKVKEATDTMQQSWQDEYLFKCADGTYKQIQDKGFVVYENGLPVKMIGSLQDVSVLKELKDALEDERLERQKEISETVIRVEETERTRIGHELHDNVNQILSTAKLFVDMITATGEDQKQIKDKSSSYLLMAIEEIRKLSKELVAPQLKQESLENSIQVLVDDIVLAKKMKINFNYHVDNCMLSEGKKITLFRIVQEQMKNILKHSAATITDISLKTVEEKVQLTIRDNGKGFNLRNTRHGIGLSNIYERTKFYNGVADVNTEPGKGCTLTISLPIFS
jgi:PAS domain S-box-containing protein